MKVGYLKLINKLVSTIEALVFQSKNFYFNGDRCKQLKVQFHPRKLIVETITMNNDIIVRRFKLKGTIMWSMSLTICKFFWPIPHLTKQNTKKSRSLELLGPGRFVLHKNVVNVILHFAFLVMETSSSSPHSPIVASLTYESPFHQIKSV